MQWVRENTQNLILKDQFLTEWPVFTNWFSQGLGLIIQYKSVKFKIKPINIGGY